MAQTGNRCRRSFLGHGQVVISEVQAAIVFHIADHMTVDHDAALASGPEDRSVLTVAEQRASVDLAIFRGLNRAKKPKIIIDLSHLSPSAGHRPGTGSLNDLQ